MVKDDLKVSDYMPARPAADSLQECLECGEPIMVSHDFAPPRWVHARLMAPVASLADAPDHAAVLAGICTVCQHSARAHSTDQEVDADGRPISPEYLVCFDCMEEDVPVGTWSHDFQ